MKLEHSCSLSIHIDDIAAFGARLFNAPPLDIARVHNGRTIMQNTAFMYMSERPVVISPVNQVLAAAGRVSFMLKITIHIAMQQCDMKQIASRHTLEPQRRIFRYFGGGIG
ncbi:hypothetical protein D3C81_1717290 [compost metagenome]